MNERLEAMQRDYLSALGEYVRAGDEPSRSLAYELGRRAMVDGFGVLEMAALHRAAVCGLVLPADAGEQRRVADRVEDFFEELVSPFEMSLRGYRSANEELRRLNGDLERRKEEVELANRELESFSYSVSHDLRAPLRSIEGFSQILVEEVAEGLNDHGRKYLRHLREAAVRMGQLIDDLLALASVTRTDIHRADVDLTALVRRICSTMQARAPQRSCRFSIQDDIRGMGDARLLEVLFENLLGNAWKFTSKVAQAEISFGREEHEGTPTYFVRDNGAGFDMKYASKLFGAFQRLHSSQDFEGTGVGLATVQRVVHRHGGRIWAEARVGFGATFKFTLGRRQEP